MVTVSRTKKRQTACWLLSSDYYPVASTPSLPLTVSVAAAADKIGNTLVTFANTTANGFTTTMNAGSDLYGCDQVIYSGRIVNRCPIQAELSASGQPVIAFNVARQMLNNPNSNVTWSFTLDPEYPTNQIRFLTRIGTVGNMDIREFLPVGGKRYYKRIWRNSAQTEYYADPYGRVPLVIRAAEIPIDEIVVPRTTHTVDSTDPDNVVITLGTTLGVKKTLASQFVCPQVNTLPGLADAFAFIALYGGTIAAGNYFFRSSLVTKPFMTQMSHDGWFLLASSNSGGTAAPMGEGYLLTQGASQHLPAAIASSLNMLNLAMSDSYNGTATPARFLVSNSATMIARAKSLTSLSQAIGDNASWTSIGATTFSCSVLTAPTAAQPFTDKVWTSSGMNAHLHWVPTSNGAMTSLTGPVRSQLNLWFTV